MKITTRSGRSIDSRFASHLEAFNVLQSLVASGKVTGGFPTSLVAAFQSSRCSQEQINWIPVLVFDAEQSQVEAATAVKIDFSQVNLILATALSKGLLSPRLRFHGIAVTVRRGVTTVTRDRRPLGTVLNHELVLVNNITPEDRAELEKLAADPISYASLFGQRTGSCMFCGLMLTTAESVGSGYGPICAEKWGLPWENSMGAQREKLVRLHQQLKEEQEKIL